MALTFIELDFHRGLWRCDLCGWESQQMPLSNKSSLPPSHRCKPRPEPRRNHCLDREQGRRNEELQDSPAPTQRPPSCFTLTR